jgi:hypothetical protein
MPLKEGAPQVPTEDMQTKPAELSGAVIWSKDKEKVDDPREQPATRREQGKSIEEAGGKSDKL